MRALTLAGDPLDRILKLLSGLLDAPLGSIRASLRFEVSVPGCAPRALFELPLGLLAFIANLVGISHCSSSCRVSLEPLTHTRTARFQTTRPGEGSKSVLLLGPIRRPGHRSPRSCRAGGTA